MLQLVSFNEVPRQVGPAPSDDIPLLTETFTQLADLCVSENGLGLAAPQVGLPWNMFVVKSGERECLFFLDCQYLPAGESKRKVREGCLSIKGKAFEVPRYERIRLRGQAFHPGPDGDLYLVDCQVSFEENGLFCAVFQHEIDHCHGVFISDIGEETAGVDA